MNIDELRELCLSFPGATEQIQWENNLLFKVGGKMFGVVPLEPARVWLTLKADPDEFAELTELPGVLPAPYLARAKWIAIESPSTLPPAAVAALLRKSYDLVVAKLPRAAQRSLPSAPGNSKSRARKTKRRNSKKARKKSG
jgi:predicted DNA-binding protein (MmcQ/YjbR family)